MAVGHMTHGLALAVDHMTHGLVMAMGHQTRGQPWVNGLIYFSFFLVGIPTFEQDVSKIERINGWYTYI